MHTQLPCKPQRRAVAGYRILALRKHAAAVRRSVCGFEIGGPQANAGARPEAVGAEGDTTTPSSMAHHSGGGVSEPVTLNSALGLDEEYTLEVACQQMREACGKSKQVHGLDYSGVSLQLLTPQCCTWQVVLRGCRVTARQVGLLHALGVAVQAPARCGPVGPEELGMTWSRYVCGSLTCPTVPPLTPSTTHTLPPHPAAS